jgi:hypothetical protein
MVLDVAIVHFCKCSIKAKLSIVTKEYFNIKQRNAFFLIHKCSICAILYKPWDVALDIVRDGHLSAGCFNEKPLTESLIAMKPWHIHRLVVPSLQM